MTEVCANGAAFVSGKITAILSYVSIVGITPRQRKEKDIRKLFIAKVKERSFMGRILDTIPSSSNPGKTYDIIEGKDGVIYCTCTAWKMRKNCKHLKEWTRKNITPENLVQDAKPGSIDEVVSAEVQKLLCR